MKLEYRLPTENEINRIKEFDNEGLSNFFNDPYTMDSGIIFNDEGNKILGAGIVRVLEEVRTTINPNLNNFEKAKIIKLLVENAIKRRKTTEILAFISKGGIYYQDLLQRHFGFNPIDKGVIPMKLEL